MTRANGVMRRPRRCITLVSLSAVLVLAGCQSHPDRTTHGEGRGPLSAQNGGGGNSIYEPFDVEYPWYATFGSFMLCLQQGHAPITLESVTWDVADDGATPLKVTPWLRHVDKTTEPAGPASSFIGLPWEVESRGGRGLRGTFSERIAGVEITKTCADLDAERKKSNQPEFTELMFVVKTAREGGHLTRAYIDYLADGEPYRLVINWEMVTCGYVVEQRSDVWCKPDRHKRPTSG